MGLPTHEARIVVLCPLCNEAVTTSVYWAQRNEKTTRPGCGAAIDLRSAETQREADQAERDWRARWDSEQEHPNEAQATRGAS